MGAVRSGWVAGAKGHTSIAPAHPGDQCVNPSTKTSSRSRTLVGQGPSRRRGRRAASVRSRPPRSVTVLAATCLEAGTLATLALLQGAGAAEFLRAQGVAFRAIG